jgi:AcrR family transcriptional regulator
METPASVPRPPLRPDDGRLVRGRASRERILAAARELFREHGFDGATLRAIAGRCGMGASSLYRHIRSKEELLVEDLAVRQEEAWRRFRGDDDRSRPARERLARFFAYQHQLLSEDTDLTTIALRALTHPEARVSRRVLALHDRTIGLLAEILLQGRMRGDLARDADVMLASRALFHAALGARISWANGLLSADGCAAAIESSLELLFRGVGRADGVGAPVAG